MKYVEKDPSDNERYIIYEEGEDPFFLRRPTSSGNEGCFLKTMFIAFLLGLCCIGIFALGVWLFNVVSDMLLTKHY